VRGVKFEVLGLLIPSLLRDAGSASEGAPFPYEINVVSTEERFGK